MASESWVLDGVILTGGTFTLMELAADPPRARMDWITAADSENAALFRQPLHENRKITMKLRVTPQASMDAALDQVGVLVDKLRKASNTADGIALVWTPTDSARARTFDVLAGEITGLPISLSGDGYSWVLHQPIVTIELTCKPYWRGTETLTSTATASTPFVAMEVASVTGDAPATGRDIVSNTGTVPFRWVEWGQEGALTYNNATSLILDSDGLVTTGFAGTGATRTGAYDPGAAGSSVITCTVDGTSTAMCGTAVQSHVGAFRVIARVWTASTAIRLRLSWRTASGSYSTNEWAAPPVTSAFARVDLGQITVPNVLLGTQAWDGRLEAYTTDGTAQSVDVDLIGLIPLSDGYGKIRGGFAYTTGSNVARDAFVGTTATALLNARVAPLGGTWATSGAATDFSFVDTFTLGTNTTESIVRETNVVEAGGRFAILGATNYTDMEVGVLVFRNSTLSGATFEEAVVARWVDASNYLRLVAPRSGATRLEQVVAGTATTLATSGILDDGSSTVKKVYQLIIIAYASGRVSGVVRDAGQVIQVLDATSTAVATGGALASGKPGIHDRKPAVDAAASRTYTNFYSALPAAEPVAVYPSRKLFIRGDDTIREDSTGTYTSRPPSYRGSRFTVPVGTGRVAVFAHPNDLDAAPWEPAIPSFSVQVGWTPRGLAIPR